MNTDWNAQEQIDHLKKVIAEEISNTPARFKALVVDDNDGDSFLLANLLILWPCDVTCVRTGTEAVEKVIGDGFRVVFLDLKLPGISGAATLSKIRATGKDVCVVVVTGYANDETIYETVRSAGPVIVISKPVKEADLQMVLGTSLLKGGVL